MKAIELEEFINDLLNSNSIKDYTPNGIQIAGKENINKIVTGVTASLELINFAIEQKADAILVHHGYFWNGETPNIVGMKYQRIKKIINNNINLFAYHLPLDMDINIGNNACIAKELGLININPLKENPVVFKGYFKEPIYIKELEQIIKSKFNFNIDNYETRVLSETSNGPDLIYSVGICSGGGQNFIELAYSNKCDVYITGELSEQTTHIAKELNKHFFAIGHHNSEILGIKTLGEVIKQEFNIEVIFKDCPNIA